MCDKADGKLDLPACSHLPLMVLIKFGADMPKLLLVGLVERTCAKTVVREIPGIVDCFQLAGDDKDGKIVVRSPDRPLCTAFASIHLAPTALYEWLEHCWSLGILFLPGSIDQRRRHLYKPHRRAFADIWRGGCSYGDCEGDECRLRRL